jgi:DNA-binding CsgD family transcriptional regulator
MQLTRVISPSLVGRRDALAHLDARRREAAAGHGGLVLVAGEAGIGKSRLLGEFRRQLASARVRVGVAHCSEFAQRPYAPILDALAEIGGVAEPAPAESQRMQFAATSAAFRAAARSRTVVAIVEDIHWADPASVELLWTIARDAAAARLLIVASYRPEALADEHPAFHGLSKLRRLPNAGSLELEPLVERDIQALIDAALGGAGVKLPHDLRARIARLSEGNPLFAEELLKTAVDRSGSPAAGSALPLTIRAAVLERLRPLASSDQIVLAQAAVIGRRFTTELLRATVGPEAAILEALRRARGLQLIEEERPGEFSFHHALTREAIYESFLAAQVREFHARIVAAIEELPPERRALQDLAYHCWAANEREKTALYGERAGDAARDLFAHDEAARLYGYSLDAIDRNSPQSAALLIKIGYARGLSGAKAQSREAMDEARRIYRAFGDLAGEVAACVEYAAGSYSLKAPAPEAPLVELRARLGAPEHAELRLRVDIALAQLLALTGKGDAAALLDAVAPALRDDQPRLTAVYHATRANIGATRSDAAAYAASLAQGLRAAAQTGIPNYEAVILSNAASAFSDLGRYDMADAYFARAEAFAKEHKLSSTLAFVYATRARRRFLGGDLAAARADVLEALSIGAHYEVARPFTASVGTALGMLLEDESLLATCFDEALIGVGSPRQIAAPYAERLYALGRYDEAGEVLRAALAEPDDPRTPFELYLAAARFGAAADVAGARESVARFAAAPQDIVYKATLPLFDAYAAGRSGRPPGPDENAARAAVAFRELGLPLFEAAALELALDGDVALELYRNAGAVAPLRRLQLAQAEPKRRAPGRSLTDLTAREREVVRFVRRGLSNVEIAEHMSVSVKMIEKHLSSVYLKLGVGSRSKLLAHLLAQTGESH